MTEYRPTSPRDLDGATVLAESATHDRDYRLITYTLHQDQLRTDRDHHRQQRYRVTFRSEGRERTETVTPPVVVGPTLVGHLVRNLDRLRAGEVLPVRFAVLERLATVGFRLRGLPSGQVRITALNWLYRLVLRPVVFTFDDAGLLVRLEGRVPSKVRVGERWKDLDARVEYRFVAERYR